MKWIVNNSKFKALGYEVNEFEGKEIDLISVKELHRIQKVSPNTMMVNIFGRTCLAKDANDDNRGGFSAYAVL